ncbi:MAG: alkaline phosphatase family protein, partial [Dehalococcoidia bacterium]
MHDPSDLCIPRYGEASLAEVVPSLLSALGASGFANPLAIEPLAGACLLLIDGLGWQVLREHARDAPFLSSLAAGAKPLTSGFPSTTAASLASVGTGLPPGEHGFVGCT